MYSKLTSSFALFLAASTILSSSSLATATKQKPALRGIVSSDPQDTKCYRFPVTDASGTLQNLTCHEIGYFVRAKSTAWTDSHDLSNLCEIKEVAENCAASCKAKKGKSYDDCGFDDAEDESKPKDARRLEFACEDTQGYMFDAFSQLDQNGIPIGLGLIQDQLDEEDGTTQGNCEFIRQSFKDKQCGKNVELDWTEYCSSVNKEIIENCCASCYNLVDGLPDTTGCGFGPEGANVAPRIDGPMRPITNDPVIDVFTCKDTQFYEFPGPKKEGKIVFGKCEDIRQTFESMENGEVVEVDWTEYCAYEDVQKHCCSSCNHLEVDLPDNTGCWSSGPMDGHLAPSVVRTTGPFGIIP